MQYAQFNMHNAICTAQYAQCIMHIALGAINLLRNPKGGEGGVHQNITLVLQITGGGGGGSPGSITQSKSLNICQNFLVN